MAPFESRDFLKRPNQSFCKKTRAAVGVDEQFAGTGHGDNGLGEELRRRRVDLREAARGVGFAESEAILAARGIFSEIGKLDIHCIRGERAFGDIHELVGFAVVKPDPLLIEVDRDAVSVGPLAGRGEHGIHGGIGDFCHSAEEIADLGGFDFELEIVSGVLEGATAALAIDRALWRHPAGRGFENPDDLSLGVVFLFLCDPRENAFARKCSMHKTNASVGKSAHASASVAEAFDREGGFGWG